MTTNPKSNPSEVVFSQIQDIPAKFDRNIEIYNNQKLINLLIIAKRRKQMNLLEVSWIKGVLKLLSIKVKLQK
jgi:hypothetical protein